MLRRYTSRVSTCKYICALWAMVVKYTSRVGEGKTLVG